MMGGGANPGNERGRGSRGQWDVLEKEGGGGRGEKAEAPV